MHNRYAAAAVVILVVSNLLCYLFNEHSILYKKLPKLPKLFFTSNRHKYAHKRPRKYWAWDVLNPAHTSTSWWLPPEGLLLVRILILCYVAATLVITGTTGNKWGNPAADWVTYFTNWSFLLIGATELLGVAASVRYLLYRARLRHAAKHGHHSGHAAPRPAGTAGPTRPAGAAPPSAQPAAAAPGQDSMADVEQAAPVEAGADGNCVAGKGGQCAEELRWSFLEKLFCILLEVAADAAVFVTAYYWGALSRDGIDPELGSYFVHGGNIPIIFLDVLLSRVPFVSYHFQAFVIYGSIYELFMWIFYGVGEEWRYTIFDWSNAWHLAVYAALPVSGFVIHCIWTLVAWLREQLGRSCGGCGVVGDADCPPDYPLHPAPLRMAPAAPSQPAKSDNRTEINLGTRAAIPATSAV